MTKKGDTCYYFRTNIAIYSFQQLYIDCMVFAPHSKAGCLNLCEKPSFNDGHGGHWLHNIEWDVSSICVSLCSVTKQTAYQELQPEMLQYRELIKHRSVLVPPEETAADCTCVSQEVRLPWQGESSGVWGAATQMLWSTWMCLPRLGVTWKSRRRWRLQLLHKADDVRTKKPRSWLSFFGLLFSIFWPFHYGS